ncbi:MAG: hypothetical protein U0457_20620 [Candidatus Sericytochromatia bacterium]
MKKITFYFLFFTFYLCLNSTSYAKEEQISLEKIKDKETEEEMKKNFLSSFDLPLIDFSKKISKTWDEIIFSEFSGGFNYNYPIKESQATEGEGLGTQGRISNNQSLSMGITFNPISFYFFNVSFIKYLNPQLQAPWNPDFTYVFGYSDWHPYTFGLTYANYGGNRLNPKKEKNEVFTDFLGGGFSLDFKFSVPREIEKLFIIHESGGLGGNIAYSVVPKYLDLASLETKNFKQSLRLSLKYTIYEWFYINGTFFYYPFPEQQQPWDPDFTYGFGYFDWHPFTVSIQYNNYSGNRYPWNKKSGSGGFENGGFSINFSWTGKKD